MIVQYRSSRKDHMNRDTGLYGNNMICFHTPIASGRGNNFYSPTHRLNNHNSHSSYHIDEVGVFYSVTHTADRKMSVQYRTLLTAAPTYPSTSGSSYTLEIEHRGKK